MDAPFLALVWRPGGLRLVELRPTGRPADVVERWQGKAPGAIGRHGRLALRLWRAGQVLVVGLPGDPLVPALRSLDGGYTFAPVPPVPAARPAALMGCQAHHDGSVTMVEGEPMPEARTAPQVLHRLPPAATAWDSVELPEAFSGWSVSVLNSGEPLLGGAYRTPDGRRSALLRLGSSGAQVIVPPFVRSPGWVWWLRGWLNERVDEAFTRLDTADEPWMLQQIQGTLETDHSVLSLVSGDRWRVMRVWGDDAATVWLRPRPGSVRLVMARGRLRDTADAGGSWARRDLMPAARPVLRASAGSKVRVSSAAQQGDDLLVVLTAEDWSRPEPEQLGHTSVLHTRDNERTVRELLRTEGPEEAVIAVA